LTQLLFVRNVDLQKMSKCRLILESFFINAPVAAQYSAPKRVIVVSSVHIQLNYYRLKAVGLASD
jgi:hypothetical protein